MFNLKTEEILQYDFPTNFVVSRYWKATCHDNLGIQYTATGDTKKESIEALKNRFSLTKDFEGMLD